jgi:hypothetical protein
MANTITLPSTVANAIVDDIDPDMEYAVTEYGEDVLLGFEDTDRLVFYKFVDDEIVDSGLYTYTTRVVIQDKTSERYYAVQYEQASDLPPLNVVFPDGPVEFKEVDFVEEVVTTITKHFSYKE